MEDNIPMIRGSSPILRFISNKEWNDLEENAIPFGEWHFERAGRGVKPVKGRFDPTNPNHIRYEDVIL